MYHSASVSRAAPLVAATAAFDHYIMLDASVWLAGCPRRGSGGGQCEGAGLNLNQVIIVLNWRDTFGAAAKSTSGGRSKFLQLHRLSFYQRTRFFKRYEIRGEGALA